MKKIEIYEDPYGRISLRQYSSDGKRTELVVKNEDVYHYLKMLSSDEVEEFKLLKNDEGINSVGIITNKHKIKLVDIDRLERHEKYLVPLMKKVEKKAEQDQMRKVKSKRTTSPKVTRKNKYSNCKVKVASVILTSIMAVTAISQFASIHSEGATASSTDYGYTKPYVDQLDNDDVLTHWSLHNNIDEQIQVRDEQEEQIPNLEISYENRSNTPKANHVIEEYGPLITKYANMYGVDPNLMIAIATQEKGSHSSIMDPGGATGIMQIQNAVWEGKEISAYNFETGKRDTFDVDSNMIKGLETNIRMGCMYFQNCLDYMNYNIPAAIQCYNMGSGNMRNILNAYANEQGLTKDDLLSNPFDTGWMNYRYLSDGGDESYLENVISWLGDSTNISVFNRNNDNNVELKITNSNSVKTI